MCLCCLSITTEWSGCETWILVWQSWTLYCLLSIHTNLPAMPVQYIISCTRRENNNSPIVKVFKTVDKYFEHHNSCKTAPLTDKTWAIWSNNIRKKSRRATQTNYFIPLQVYQALNHKLAGTVGDPGIFWARKSSFLGFKTPLSSFHRNEQGSTSNTVFRDKTYLKDCIPNSFLIYGPPPDVDNTSSLHACSPRSYI